MSGGAEPRRAFSVCPVCLKRIPACLTGYEDEIRLEKRCAAHGDFSAVVWRGRPERAAWIGAAPAVGPHENPNCPHGCGLCPEHRQDTCCVLLEVTQRCNLACAYCFAAAGNGPADPSFERVCAWIDDIARNGKAFLQLSGGEPTLRGDLPDLVRHAKAAGCEYVQLNSNGLRLAEDPAYLDRLAEAGLSFVFLQFDGLGDAVYQRLRGRPLLEKKIAAIEACGARNIGVTLVPTLVPGVNDGQIGELIRFAVERSPVVRGVHFQPVSYFGRYPAAKTPTDADRITLPEVYSAIFAQAGDLVPEGSIVASRCDHAACGFHGGYVVKPEGGLMALSSAEGAAQCRGPGAGTASPAERNRRFVGGRWLRPLRAGQAKQECCAGGAPASMGPPAATPPTAGEPEARDLGTLDGFLARARSHAFTLSAMAFQDAWTLDLERLRQCSLHVYANGALKPFCAHYLS